jgi:hypothetical protein
LPDVVCLFSFSRQFIFIYFYSIRKEEGRRWWVLEGRKKEGKKEGEKEREKKKVGGGEREKRTTAIGRGRHGATNLRWYNIKALATATRCRR